MIPIRRRSFACLPFVLCLTGNVLAEEYPANIVEYPAPPTVIAPAPPLLPLGDLRPTVAAQVSEEALLAQCAVDYGYCAEQVADEQVQFNQTETIRQMLAAELKQTYAAQQVAVIDTSKEKKFSSLGECQAFLSACGYTRLQEYMRTSGSLSALSKLFSAAAGKSRKK